MFLMCHNTLWWNQLWHYICLSEASPDTCPDEWSGHLLAHVWRENIDEQRVRMLNVFCFCKDFFFFMLYVRPVHAIPFLTGDEAPDKTREGRFPDLWNFEDTLGTNDGSILRTTFFWVRYTSSGGTIEPPTPISSSLTWLPPEISSSDVPS